MRLQSHRRIVGEDEVRFKEPLQFKCTSLEILSPNGVNKCLFLEVVAPKRSEWKVVAAH